MNLPHELTLFSVALPRPKIVGNSFPDSNNLGCYLSPTCRAGSSDFGNEETSWRYWYVSSNVNAINSPANRNEAKNINRLKPLSYNTCIKKKITSIAFNVAIPIEIHNSHCWSCSASVSSDMTTVMTVKNTNEKKIANSIQTGIGCEKYAWSSAVESWFASWFVIFNRSVLNLVDEVHHWEKVNPNEVD